MDGELLKNNQIFINYFCNLHPYIFLMSSLYLPYLTFSQHPQEFPVRIHQTQALVHYLHQHLPSYRN